MCFCCGFTQFHFYYGHAHGRIWNPPLRSANPVAFCLPPTSAGWGHPALRPTKKGNVGRPALWPPCPLPATANLPCNPPTLTPQTKASLVKGRPDCRKIASLPYCVCRGDHWSPVRIPPAACGVHLLPFWRYAPPPPARGSLSLTREAFLLPS